MDNAKQIIEEIKKKLEYLEELITINRSIKNTAPVHYVDLGCGDCYSKLERILKQTEELHITIIPTPHDRQTVRSAIVAVMGEKGLLYWLRIRKTAQDYDESQQVKRYENMLKYRDTNKMNFGAVVNLYKAAIDKYNTTLNK